MKQIIELTDEPNQTHYIVDELGNVITMTFIWKEITSSWYYNLTFNTFILNGCKLVNSLNLLSKYVNLLPFGIACLSNDDCDAFMQDDFVTGRIQIFTLTPTDINDINNIWGNINA